MKTKRLFIAIPLPNAVKETLVAYLEPYKKEEALQHSRWVTFDNLHVTTLFLGDVLEENIPKIQEKLQAELGKIEQFELIFEKITLAPSERRPHMIWAKFEASRQFAQLVTTLQQSLSPFAPFLDDKLREPKAHATLARLKNYYSRDSLKFRALSLPSLQVEACILMESELSNKAPIYTPLGTYSLCKSTPS